MPGTLELGLLLADGDTGEPILPGLPAVSEERAELVAGVAAERVPNDRGDLAGDLSSLPDQRWGVVIGRGSEALLQALRPLIRRREEEQGGEARVFEVPEGIEDAGAARAWVEEVYLDPATEEADRPRYLLVVGSPKEVSLELQQALAQQAMVGRACFVTPRGEPLPDAYQAYAEKVSIQKESSETGPHMMVHVSRDGTASMETAEVGLVRPLVAAMEKWQRRGLLAGSSLLPGSAPSVEELIRPMRGQAASLLFTVSHGAGAPPGGFRSPEEQRSRQGNIVLPRDVPGQMIGARQVGVGPFLPGGVWFHFGCFGAGTPARSDYAPWLAELARAHSIADGELLRVTASLPRPPEPSFIASLPQAALANPEGPLAFLGHVDLLFAYSFLDRGAPSPRGAQRIVSAVEPLLRGRRAGAAHGLLMRGFRDVNNELARLTQEEVAKRASVDPATRAELFLLRNDLKSFVLLGDPAVRLPVR